MEQTENKLPCHIAFIMDGNGRWSKAKKLPRAAGHRQGVKTLEKVLEYCKSLGIRYTTVYALSTENLSRPADEVANLIQIFKDYIDNAIKTAEKRKTRVVFIGDISILGELYEKRAKHLESITEKYEYTLIVAVNYGSRAEITRAYNLLMQEGKKSVSEKDIAEKLYTHAFPDPDLIIRTAGEERLSNFLLWQAAYSEFYFTDVLWPAFSENDVDKALSDYLSRKRNFGVKHG